MTELEREEIFLAPVSEHGRNLVAEIDGPGVGSEVGCRGSHESEIQGRVTTGIHHRTLLGLASANLREAEVVVGKFVSVAEPNMK